MYKIISKMKAVALSRLVDERFNRAIEETKKDDLEEQMKLKTQRGEVLRDIHEVSEASEKGIASLYAKRRVDGKKDDFEDCLPEFYWAVELYHGLTFLIYRIPIRVFKALKYLCTSAKELIVKSKFSNSLESLKLDSEKKYNYHSGEKYKYLEKFIPECYAKIAKDDDDQAVDYEFIWYNAWLYR